MDIKALESIYSQSLSSQVADSSFLKILGVKIKKPQVSDPVTQATRPNHNQSLTRFDSSPTFTVSPHPSLALPRLVRTDRQTAVGSHCGIRVR